MRADMKKVLCERPRRGGVYSYHDIRQRQNQGDPEDLPTHQGMRRPYGWETKNFDDLIGPLRGYLRHSVGRPWDEVWSEVCQQTPSGNTVDEHLRGHVMREVETYTFVNDNDEVYAFGRYYSEPRKVDGLYVDPRDGVLCVTAERPSLRWKSVTIDGLHYRKGDDGILYPTGWYRQTKPRFPLKMIGDQKAMLIDGIWYWIEMAVTPPSRLVEYVADDGTVRRRRVYSARQDFVTGEFVNEGRYHADKQQMCSRDLRRHGLRNTR